MMKITSSAAPPSREQLAEQRRVLHGKIAEAQKVHDKDIAPALRKARELEEEAKGLRAKATEAERRAMVANAERLRVDNVLGSVVRDAEAQFRRTLRDPHVEIAVREVHKKYADLDSARWSSEEGRQRIVATRIALLGHLKELERIEVADLDLAALDAALVALLDWSTLPMNLAAQPPKPAPATVKASAPAAAGTPFVLDLESGAAAGGAR